MTEFKNQDGAECGIRLSFILTVWPRGFGRLLSHSQQSRLGPGSRGVGPCQGGMPPTASWAYEVAARGTFVLLYEEPASLGHDFFNEGVGLSGEALSWGELWERCQVRLKLSEANVFTYGYPRGNTIPPHFALWLRPAIGASLGLVVSKPNIYTSKLHVFGIIF